MSSISDILLNETASFYTLKSEQSLSLPKIKRILKSASSGKVGDSYYALVENKTISGLNNVSYSYVAFKTKNRPYTIKKEVAIDEKWYEIKFAFFLMIHCGKYIAINRKYTGIPKELQKEIQTIDYQTFVNFLVTSETSFQKFGMFNLDMSHSVMRYKHLEAEDLRESFSSTSASSYELSSCMLSNTEGTISLSVNLSRLHKAGKRLEIDGYCRWVSRMVEKIDSYIDRYTYLNRFATPVSYSSNKPLLKPISILFITHRIEDYFRENADEVILKRKKGKGPELEEPLVFEDLLFYLSASFLIEEKDDIFLIRKKGEKNNILVGELSLEENGIRLSWSLYCDVLFKLKNGSKKHLSTVINETQAFVVYFQDCKLRYADRKLFENQQLIHSIPSFLGIFDEKPGLCKTTSEKGSLNEQSTEFEDNTIFRFIADNSDDELLILDDLGTEWGDYIGISENRVTIYVAKSDHERYFSASSFQVSIAQGLKNIGSFYPPDSLLESKKKAWNQMYSNTRIKKISDNTTVEDAIASLKKAMLSPQYKKRLVIVTDCISKKVLNEKMMKLQNNTDFPEKKEAIPMLWLISSFISTCIENGIEPRIFCKS